MDLGRGGGSHLLLFPFDWFAFSMWCLSHKQLTPLSLIKYTSASVLDAKKAKAGFFIKGDHVVLITGFRSCRLLSAHPGWCTSRLCFGQLCGSQSSACSGCLGSHRAARGLSAGGAAGSSALAGQGAGNTTGNSFSLQGFV